ncbi:MAG: aconitate hydratase, partial [Chlamydiia bacterium]|nr:aconitate hydratase [Chlamydiia bacterium]
DEKIETPIKEHDLITASVLSGNRNFEARIHGSVKANFLMSPPLVVAYAIAGNITIDLTKEPLGIGKDGEEVFLRDIWPSSDEIDAAKQKIVPNLFTRRYANILTDNPVWDQIGKETSAQYAWDPKSTYIRRPPFFENFSLQMPFRKELTHLRALALFGDSVTTDHISPAGSFKKETPAGKYLRSQGIQEEGFNSYGSRRGNHVVMMRGTFANVRIRNKLAEGKEGGFTKLLPEGPILPIFDACVEYEKKQVPLVIFAGKDYGMGSSRDWAAKGTALLGVRVVVAQSFERIHRSNLVGMGVLPLQFKEGESIESLQIRGTELFSFQGLDQLSPKQEVLLEIEEDGTKRQATLISCIDTPQEIEYYVHGGILPFVLRNLF